MAGTTGALGALGFWLFLAAIIVAGIWYDIRKRQAQHETLRRMFESGQPVDQELIDKLLGGEKRTDRDLRTAGLIVLFVAPGLAVMAWFISQLSAPWLLPLLGVAGLVAFVGIGLLVAAKVAERSYHQDRALSSGPPMAR